MALFKFSHPWNVNVHQLFLFNTTILLLTYFSSNSVSASKIQLSDHCAAFFPKPLPERLVHSAASPPPPFQRHRGYYVTAKSDVLRASPVSELSNSLRLYLFGAYETDVHGLFGLKAKLTLFKKFYGRNISNHYSDSVYRFRPSKSFSLVLRLNGFWSQPHGKLCAVGEGYNIYRSSRGESNTGPVILKLYNLYDSSNLTSLVTGSLESLVGPNQNDLNYFDPISVMFFPEMNYEYSLVSKALVDDNTIASGSESGVGLAWDSMTRSGCSVIFSRPLSLKYSSRCRSASSVKNCNPLGEPRGQLPDFLMLQNIECSHFGQKVRLLIKFPTNTSDIWNSRTLDPKATLVGEGVWDSQKNQLLVVACRFLKATDSWTEARVSDCSTRLRLKFPAIWTIGNTSSILGHIWSTKTPADSGYFEDIRFQLSEEHLEGSLDVKYKYTKIDKAKKWCPEKEPAKGKSYPDAFSSDMTFDILGDMDFARGYAQPVSVGNELYSMHLYQKNFSSVSFSNAEPHEGMDTVSYVNNSINISYWISFFGVSSKANGRFDITAEGIYDVSTGRLCMIGCRKIGLNISDLSSNDDTLDCEVLVHFQFPPRDSRLNVGFIKGSIESKRKDSDPLHFERLELFSAAYVTTEVQESIQMVNWEIMVALVSNTLACVFAVLQIFYLRRNPDFLPFVSLTMLFTLTFDYAIALGMDLKSMFVTSFESQDVLLGSGGWVVAKGLTEGVTTLILLLLQALLVQRTWSARLSHENQRALRIAENEALVASLPLYFGGPVLTFFFTWSKRNHDLATFSPALITTYYENPIWEALKSYVGVLSDGFLMPQILLNMFRDSREKALCIPFYIGTTLVRLFPHAYGLYKARNSGLESVSTLSDVIIRFVGLLLAAIVYLQQKFGGRCILAFRSRESNAFEKVTNVVAETET